MHELTHVLGYAGGTLFIVVASVIYRLSHRGEQDQNAKTPPSPDR